MRDRVAPMHHGDLSHVARRGPVGNPLADGEDAVRDPTVPLLLCAHVNTSVRAARRQMEIVSMHTDFIVHREGRDATVVVPANLSQMPPNR
jgi:hypothetical protein